MNQALYDQLVAAVGKDSVLQDEPMKKHTTFRIGGVADYFVTPCNVKGIEQVIAICKANNVPFFVMGNGSNLLVSDDGYRGVIIQILDRMNEITWDGCKANVMAGCLLSKFGNEAAKRGLTGFEFATGIPGTMGGAVMMNAGAYGGEIKDCLVRVQMMDEDGNIAWFSREEMQLGYRTSLAAKTKSIILQAEILLEKGNEEAIKDRLAQLSLERRTKQPLEYPSAGSTFKRPEGYFAGKLIEDAGLKGFVHGGAMVSEKHSGFVINKDHATAKDVLELVDIVKKKVWEQFGVKLELEVRCLGF